MDAVDVDAAADSAKNRLRAGNIHLEGMARADVWMFEPRAIASPAKNR